MQTRFQKTLSGEALDSPPIWLMRQAGRYLPEYRATRAKAGSFLDLCYNSELAAEVTLQPIRRYDFDAAILFADILLLPHAFGQRLSFVEGEGPRLEPPASAADLDGFAARDINKTLGPVYETVREVRRKLAPEKSLIGFAGAPWTVATYMLAGGPTEDPSALRKVFYDDPGFFTALIDLLVDRTGDYLISQIDAGADIVQLFDSWADGLPPAVLHAVSIDPLRRIAARVKNERPAAKVILFPKGVGAMAEAYARLPECDAVGIDHSQSWEFAHARLSPHAVVQGGLDPMLVVKGGALMEEGIHELLETFKGKPYIFNLGHGLTPDTPPENVARLVDIVRGKA